MNIRVLIADGHEMILDGLTALLRNEPGLEIVGRARDGLEAIEAALRLDPDVLILGLPLPGLNGIEATRRIRAERPRIKVLWLSMHRERQYLQAALAAGAAGYVLKDRASEHLLEAIRTVAAGGISVDPEMTAGGGV